MGKRLGRLFIIVFGASLGITILPLLWKISGLNKYEILKHNITNGIIGALIFLILSQLILNTTSIIMKQVERDLQKFSPDFLLFGMIGTILGLILGALICIPIYSIRIKGLSTLLSILVLAFFAYVGFKLGTIRIEDWKKILSPKPKKSPGEGEILERNVDDHFRKYKILDTSVIIDGRIYDILKEGFIEGVILIPNFVLYELQYIADSGDSLKRVRGRRGLDILNSLQKEDGVAVEMYEGDFDDIEEVDSKLIKLAKLLDGIVVTNDFNLNKVCEFQNVPVLNINALANAVKPVVIPGETMSVKVVKEGKERQQGIAYLDDGTMIVVEDGQYYMNKDIIVIVTSALQTAAGRMIFAKPAHAHKGINTPSDQVSDAESSKKKSVHSNQKKK